MLHILLHVVGNQAATPPATGGAKVLVNAWFSFGSALVAVVLLVLALRGYHHTQDPNMTFLAGAFMLFSLKSALVGYSLYTNAIAHDSLELVDGAGDLATLLLLSVPLLLPPPRNKN